MIDYLNIQDILDTKYLNKKYYRHFEEFIGSIIYIKNFALLKSEDYLSNSCLIINAFDEDTNEYNIKTKSKILADQFKKLFDVLIDRPDIALVNKMENNAFSVKCKKFIAVKCEKVELKNKNNKNSFYYKINSTAV